MEYTRLKDIDLKNYIGQRVNILFVARDVSVRLQRDKVTKFVVFNMFDSGVIEEARIFGASERTIEKMANKRVYTASVDVNEYDKSPSGYSCIVYDINESDVSPDRFIEWADGLGESKKVIENALGFISNSLYGTLVYNIVVNKWSLFSIWPAAKSQHHTQMGGLLKHTAEVLDIVESIADYFIDTYGQCFINKELLFAATILHDVGKITELEIDTSTGVADYSVESALNTHIMNALALVEIQAHELKLGYQVYRINEINEEEPVKSTEQLKQEKEAMDLLKHCIASHHGKLEYGSPIVPSTPETFILNAADVLDAEMFKYNKIFNDIGDASTFSKWSNGTYDRAYKDSTK